MERWCIKLDEQIRKTMNVFYGFPKGFTTEDFYDEYVDICIKDGVEPRNKAIVIREVCKETNLKIRILKTHYFVEG